MRLGTLVTAAVATVLSLATATAAQNRPTPGASPQQPPPDIPSLLKLRDPRLQARGAWYAGVGRLRQFAPLVQDVVRQRVQAPGLSGATLDIARDALIQMQSPLDAVLWPEVYAVRPAQALVAAAFAKDIDESLRDVVRFGTGYDWFAAANLLLMRNPRALVPDVLAPLRLKLKVFVVDDGHMMGSGSGSGIGIGCGAAGLAAGLPPWAAYTLTSYAHVGVTVLAMGPTPIYYQRTVAPAGETPSASMFSIGGPTGYDRIVYAAAAAGIDAASVPLRGEEQHSVSVPHGGSFDAEVTRLKADLADRFRQFVHSLVALDILPANAVAAYQPPIDVEVEDHRSA